MCRTAPSPLPAGYTPVSEGFLGSNRGPCLRNTPQDTILLTPSLYPTYIPLPSSARTSSVSSSPSQGADTVPLCPRYCHIRQTVAVTLQAKVYSWRHSRIWHPLSLQPLPPPIPDTPEHNPHSNLAHIDNLMLISCISGGPKYHQA